MYLKCYYNQLEINVLCILRDKNRTFVFLYFSIKGQKPNIPWNLLQFKRLEKDFFRKFLVLDERKVPYLVLDERKVPYLVLVINIRVLFIKLW